MGKDISDEDRALFRHNIGEVKPLKYEKILLTKPKKKLTATVIDYEIKNAKIETARLEDVSIDDKLWFSRDGVQPKQLKNLRQGKLTCQAECDLHGLTVEQARIILEQFIYEALAQGLRYIRIIHGKGYRSENQRPKLKNFVNQALQEFADVLAFCSARSKDGGSGAVYVLLRAR